MNAASANAQRPTHSAKRLPLSFATLAFTACCLLTAVGLWWLANTERTSAHTAQLQWRTQLQDLQQRYEREREARRQYQRHAGQITQWQLEQRQNDIATRRLDWIEALEAGQSRLALPGLRYQIGRRLPLASGQDTQSHDTKAQTTAAPARAQGYATEVEIELDLLHSGDLYHFLHHLQERLSQPFATHTCQLQRAPTWLATASSPPTQPHQAPQDLAGNLSARCKLAWYDIALDAQSADSAHSERAH